MGSDSSSIEQTQCCGLVYDYKKACQKLKAQIEKYNRSLKDNLGEFQGKKAQSARRDLNQAKQQAYELLKDGDENRARKVLKDILLNNNQDDRQGKLLTRQIDFLYKKQKDLQDLNQSISQRPKPKSKGDQRDQNKDQLSGDSGDIESYVDVNILLRQRMIDELKDRIEKESRAAIQQKNAQKEASMIKVASVVKESSVKKQPVYAAKEYRDRFLEKLRRSSKQNERTCRKLTSEQIQFFRSKLSIQVGRNLTQRNQPTLNSKASQNSPYKSGYNYDRQNVGQSSINISYPDELSQASYIRPQYDEEAGYYLNLSGYRNLDVSQFVKGDWSIVEVMDLQECNITAYDWKLLVKAKSTAFPNLKVLYLGLNQIMEVNESELNSFKGVRYLSFGWWDKSNQLNPQSRKVLARYQQRNPNIKIQFNKFG